MVVQGLKKVVSHCEIETDENHSVVTHYISTPEQPLDHQAQADGMHAVAPEVSVAYVQRLPTASPKGPNLVALLFCPSQGLTQGTCRL